MGSSITMKDISYAMTFFFWIAGCLVFDSSIPISILFCFFALYTYALGSIVTDDKEEDVKAEKIIDISSKRYPNKNKNIAA